jgi:large subunit ribosomal protein L35Ae
MVNILSQNINGRIINYRTGTSSQQSKECLVELNNVNSASLAGKLIGQKVVWMSGKNKFTGKIVGLHGRNGTVRVKFARPVPGQAIGTVVQLIG